MSEQRLLFPSCVVLLIGCFDKKVQEAVTRVVFLIYSASQEHEWHLLILRAVHRRCVAHTTVVSLLLDVSGMASVVMDTLASKTEMMGAVGKSSCNFLKNGTIWDRT